MEHFRDTNQETVTIILKEYAPDIDEGTQFTTQTEQ